MPRSFPVETLSCADVDKQAVMSLNSPYDKYERKCLLTLSLFSNFVLFESVKTKLFRTDCHNGQKSLDNNSF